RVIDGVGQRIVLRPEPEDLVRQVVRQDVAQQALVGVCGQRDELSQPDLARPKRRRPALALVADISSRFAVHLSPDRDVRKSPLVVIDAAKERLLPPALRANERPRPPLAVATEDLLDQRLVLFRHAHSTALWSSRLVR